MKKRLLLMCFLVLMSTVIAGCTKTENNEDKIKVIAVNFPAYDLAKQIGGEAVKVSMLIKPGTETHSFDPTPKDMIAIAECDLFIYGGGESDEWVETLLSGKEYKNLRTLKMMDVVTLFEEEEKEGMTVGEDESEEPGMSEVSEESEYDEHVWTSPINALKIAEAIKNEFVLIDSRESVAFEENYTVFSTEIMALDRDFRELFDGKEITMIFGDRFPFLYFEREYDIDYFAAFPGCAAETEASATTIAYLIDKVNKDENKAVFYLELSNAKVADTICEATGAKKVLFHSCHNVTRDEWESGVTYLSLMRDNYNRLKEIYGN